MPGRWSPTCLCRATGAGEQGVLSRGLSPGDTHGTQEPRQSQAAGWRAGCRGEVGRLSSVRPLWGPSPGTPHGLLVLQFRSSLHKAQRRATWGILTASHPPSSVSVWDTRPSTSTVLTAKSQQRLPPHRPPLPPTHKGSARPCRARRDSNGKNDIDVHMGGTPVRTARSS